MTKLTHYTIKDGWFSEVSDDSFPGQAMQLRVDEILHVEQSQYQDVLVFKSTDYGNVLVLDGVIQASERDEFAYQEMITHLALNSHPNPKRVLVIGGGDGGVLREIVKHDSVEEAVLVEIDECVIRVSKQYLPDMARGFDHPKVTLKVEDGFKYLADLTDKFDVIITDSSDPEGPAAALFGVPFYNLLSRSLADDNGIVVTQCSENIWLNLDLLKEFRDTCHKVFPVVEYAYTTVPTYTSGQLGLFVCCKNPAANVKIPLRKWDSETEATINRYYNSDLHSASFVLPTWAKLVLGGK